MKRLLTAAALLGVLLIPACSENASQPVPDGIAGDSGYTGNLGVPSTPYESNGIWSVPDDIAPGRYAVSPSMAPVISLRWVQGCTDRYCEDITDAVFAYAPEGGGRAYINIPADGSVQAINNTGVTLTRVE